MQVTTTNAAALFEMDQTIHRQNDEITRLRKYRKRAKRAYRNLQAAHGRVLADNVANKVINAHLTRSVCELRQK